MGNSSDRRGKLSRPHLAPPPPAWRFAPADKPLGFQILDEVGGNLGIALWLSLRAVWTWVEAAPRRRRKIGAKGEPKQADVWEAAIDGAPELTEPLSVFAAALTRGSTVSSDEFAAACSDVQNWAAAYPLVETEIHFAKAAARVDAANSLRASEAGRVCRVHALHTRAGDWFYRAYIIALRMRARDASVRALLGYGACLKDMGREQEARVFFRRAARRAARFGRRGQAAEAFHDLLAERALELYPLHNPACRTSPTTLPLP